mgnify:CR=1 FL=1
MCVLWVNIVFNTIKDESITALIGSKFDTDATRNLNINTNLGLEYDVTHSIDKLEPTGMSGLPTVNLDTNYRQIRPIMSFGFDYTLSSNTKFSATFNHKTLPYNEMKETTAYVYLSTAW